MRQSRYNLRSRNKSFKIPESLKMRVTHLLLDEFKWECEFRGIEPKSANAYDKLELILNLNRRDPIDYAKIDRGQFKSNELIESISNSYDGLLEDYNDAQRTSDLSIYPIIETRATHLMHKLDMIEHFSPGLPTVKRLAGNLIVLVNQVLGAARDILGSPDQQADLLIDSAIVDAIVSDQPTEVLNNFSHSATRPIGGAIPRTTNRNYAPPIPSPRQGNNHFQPNLQPITAIFNPNGFTSRTDDSNFRTNVPNTGSNNRISNIFQPNNEYSFPPPNFGSNRALANGQDENLRHDQRRVNRNGNATNQSLHNFNGQRNQPNCSRQINFNRQNGHANEQTRNPDRDRNLGNNQNRTNDSSGFNDWQNGNMVNDAVPVNRNDRRPNFISAWNVNFSGEGDKLPVAEFLFRVETMAQGDNISSSTLASNLHYILSGNALTWYWLFKRLNPAATWMTLRETLRKEFGGQETDYEIRKAVENRKQSHRESFGDFRLAIETLMARLRNPLAEREKVAIMRRNMRSDLQKALVMYTFNSVVELRDACRRHENLWAQLGEMVQSRRKEVAEVEEIVDLCDNYYEPYAVEEIELNRNRAKPQNRDQTYWVCWNCKDLGHGWMECPSPDRKIFCYSCGTPNVIKPNCNNCKKNQGNGQNPIGRSGRIPRHVQAPTGTNVRLSPRQQ